MTDPSDVMSGLLLLLAVGTLPVLIISIFLRRLRQRFGPPCGFTVAASLMVLGAHLDSWFPFLWGLFVCALHWIICLAPDKPAQIQKENAGEKTC